MTDEQFELQYEELKDQFATCYAMILEIRDMMLKADTTITSISSQVEPLIEDIRTGGIMKLLSGGLKRK